MDLTSQVGGRADIGVGVVGISGLGVVRVHITRRGQVGRVVEAKLDAFVEWYWIGFGVGAAV